MKPTFLGATILNVDDHEGCRFAVTRLLEHNAFRVREASNGSEALAIARSERPDLVLLDINLPDISGLEVCRRLKSEPATARIPVLHLTAAQLRPEDMARSLESGADSYLMEPVEPDVLVATVNALLRTKRAEDSAVAVAREWESTFDVISDGVAILDSNGKIRRCNQSLARMLDIPVDQLVNTSSLKIFEELPRSRQPFPQAIQTGTRQTIELDYDGRRLAVSVDPAYDELGHISGAVQIVRDLTEQRRLEEQFRESQKFETIGTLAGGVAHDFNNLLTSIMGNASLVSADLPADSPHRERLDDIVHAGQRAADLTRQLLAYSGKGRHFMQKVELSALIEQMRDLIEAAVPKKITLEMWLKQGLARIDADVNQVQQVILNLVSNAAEAIGEDAGSITISTGCDENNNVLLEVKDTGCGMDEDVRSRMFDPFFTTKFTGRGLGLAAVAGIVRGHKATIQVQSTRGAGSTLRISFPAAEEPAHVQARANNRTEDLEGAGIVLVVDDEDMVRRIAKAALEVRGYNVMLANNGREAIDVAVQHPEIRLVLLDLTMPVMGGEEAIDGIMKACPNARVIVSTGYDHREMAARFTQKKVAGFLQKPYTSRQLAEKVKAILGTGAVSA